MSDAKKIVNRLLVEIFNRILAIEGEALKKDGIKLSMTEIHVLEAVRDVTEPTMTMIANKLGVTVGSATTSINTLFQKGYVSRSRDEEDRRKVLVVLDEKALDVLRLHDEFHEQMIDAVFEDLGIEEDEILIASLRKVSSYFTKDAE